MNIIINGVTIDTRTIWKVEKLYGNPSWREAGIRIGIIDKDDLIFGKEYPDDIDGHIMQRHQSKYDEEMNKIIDLWEKEKIDMPIFIV